MLQILRDRHLSCSFDDLVLHVQWESGSSSPIRGSQSSRSCDDWATVHCRSTSTRQTASVEMNVNLWMDTCLRFCKFHISFAFSRILPPRPQVIPLFFECPLPPPTPHPSPTYSLQNLSRSADKCRPGHDPPTRPSPSKRDPCMKAVGWGMRTKTVYTQSRHHRFHEKWTFKTRLIFA